MKRFASLLIALLMATSVLLTACQQEKEPEVTLEEQQDQKPREMTGSAIPQGDEQ